MIGRRKPETDERTEQERATAAAERMRRRGLEPATAAGRPVDEWIFEPPPPRASRGVPQDTADPEAPQAEPEQPVPPQPAAPQPEPEPVVAPEPEPEPEPMPEPAAPQPEPLPPAAAAPPPAEDSEPLPRRELPPLPPRGPRKPVKRAAPPRRVPRNRRAAPPLHGRPPGRPLPPAARGGSRWGPRLAALAAVLVVLGLGWMAYRTFQPGHGDPGPRLAVTVPPGADAGQIGKLLAAKGVVDSATFFTINATVTGRRGKLRSGDYVLRRDMTYGAAIDALVAGPPPPKVVKTFDVTLPEGLARTEMAPLVRRGGVRGSYLKASVSRRALRQAHRLGLPRSRRTTEGFLFPATYELVRGAKARALVDKQLQAYRQQVSRVSFKGARHKNLTRYDVLIIASMVERETQLDRERPLVAAVIYNRLRDGMPLGIDATIRYAEDNWTRPLRVSELERPGPYNTRLNVGLPPTPIGNPGLASIKAAAAPANVDYLYYVVKPGTRGHAFSSTDAQFERDLQRYNAAREANGGDSPTP